MSVVTVDCQYLRPRFAASYLLREGDEAIFVENNTAHSVPLLLHALEREGLEPSRVRYLIVTHVHLDHAGGTHALLARCSGATVLAHPRAVSHLVDPSKLVASARKVYGDEEFTRLYGEIGPIPAARVRAMADGESLVFGTRRLTFLHTRGHANHHFCVLDSGSEGVFTGDAFGLAYPDLQGQGLFIFPSTSPTDFDPGEARLSIDRILATGASRAFLTHFGEVSDLQAAAEQLRAYLDFAEPLYSEIVGTPLGDRPAEELAARCEREIGSFLEGGFRALGAMPDGLFAGITRLDIELNASGLVFAAQKKRKGLSNPVAP